MVKFTDLRKVRCRLALHEATVGGPSCIGCAAVNWAVGRGISLGPAIGRVVTWGIAGGCRVHCSRQRVWFALATGGSADGVSASVIGNTIRVWGYWGKTVPGETRGVSATAENREHGVVGGYRHGATRSRHCPATSRAILAACFSCMRHASIVIRRRCWWWHFRKPYGQGGPQWMPPATHRRFCGSPRQRWWATGISNGK